MARWDLVSPTSKARPESRWMSSRTAPPAWIFTIPKADCAPHWLSARLGRRASAFTTKTASPPGEFRSHPRHPFEEGSLHATPATSNADTGTTLLRGERMWRTGIWLLWPSGLRLRSLLVWMACLHSRLLTGFHRPPSLGGPSLWPRASPDVWRWPSGRPWRGRTHGG